MMPLSCVLPVCVGLLLLPQDNKDRIGKIEFFGSSGLDVSSIRKSLPVQEADRFPTSDDELLALIKRIKQAVEQRVARPATDIAPICCDEQGMWMIYVGLPGTSVKQIAYNPKPAGVALLPQHIVKAYDEAMEAIPDAVRRGAGEDHSKGYALSTDPVLRNRQLALREEALRNEHHLYPVLKSSRDARHRAVAAQVLGYAPKSEKQLAALMRASRDANETVRNNAIRALGVLADSTPSRAGQIPAAEFLPLLSSGTWTDRNKALGLLATLSRSRDPKLLSALRRRGTADLMEMAQWRNSGHADPARVLLGRIAGIPEDRLQELIRSHQVEPIIAAARGRFQ